MINFKSIIKNLGANSIAMLINICIQLSSVPIFINFWGINLYGEWIILNSLTAYLLISDIGISTATSNDFSICYVQSQYTRCNILLNNYFLFISALFSIVLFFLIIILFNFNLTALFNLKIISEKTAEIGLVILVFQVFLGMLENIYLSIYRATQHYSRGVMIDNSIRIIQTLFLFCAVVLKLDLIYVFLLFLFPKILGFAFKFIDTMKYFKLHFSVNYFNRKEFKRIFLLGLPFLSSPIANSFTVQGFTIMVGFFIGSAAVVLFNTTRTIINVAKTGLSLVGYSVWPDLTLLYGKNDLINLKKLHRYTVSVSFLFSLIVFVFLGLFGKYIYIIWTDGKVEFSYTLFFTFLLSIVTNSIWFSSSVLLGATNNHKKYSIIFLIASIFSMAIAYQIFLLTTSWELIPLSFIAIDLIMIIVVLQQSLRIVNDSIGDFLYSIITLPFIQSKQILRRMK